MAAAYPIFPTTSLLEALVDEIRSTRAYQTSEIQLNDTGTLCNAAGIPIHDDENAGGAFAATTGGFGRWCEQHQRIGAARRVVAPPLRPTR